MDFERGDIVRSKINIRPFLILFVFSDKYKIFDIYQNNEKRVNKDNVNREFERIANIEKYLI